MTQLQHLLDIESLSLEQIEGILQAAVGFKQLSERTIKKVPSLRGCVPGDERLGGGRRDDKDAVPRVHVSI